MIEKNSWVQIQKIVLEPQDRATHLPEETKKVPLIMWVKGRLQQSAELGSLVQIKTLTGRIESGVLICKNPSYLHTYGTFIPEILEIDRIVKNQLFGGDSNE